MKKPYSKFTAIGLLLGSVVACAPWFFAGNTTTTICQAFGPVTVVAFGLLSAFAAYISSPADQPAKDENSSLMKAV